MAKSVWKALWLRVQNIRDYKSIWCYLSMVVAGWHTKMRQYIIDILCGIVHIKTGKQLGNEFLFPLFAIPNPKKPLPWKEKNMSGVQHPCHVLHYLRKWLSSNDEVLVGMLIAPEKGLCVDIKWINEVKKLLFKGIIVVLRNFYTKYFVIQNILRTFVA